MNAVLLHRERLDLDDGSIVEMVLWCVVVLRRSSNW
jgi:hypothetical protein